MSGGVTQATSIWNPKKIGDILILEYGKALKNYQNVNGQYPVFGTNGQIGTADSYLYDKPSIVIGRKGAYRGVHYANGPFSVIDTAFYTKNKTQDLSTEFMYYWFKCVDINSMDSGSAIPSTSRDEVYDLDILLPPPAEQKKLATVLSSLDDKIDLLHRQNQTLEAMAATLFRQWFVEEAQEDWKLEKLGECVTISYGKNLPTKNLLSEGFPVFGANGQIGFYDRYTYEDPQVLVSCRGEASGKINISLPKSFVTNNSLALERNKRSGISFEFLKYWALSYDFNLHVSGSAQPQITIDGLYDAEFIFPSAGRISKFTDTVRPIEEKRYANDLQIRTLEKLRDNLLPKLMSGEVRVKV